MTKKTIHCLLCGKDNVSPADAHVFPKGYFDPLKTGQFQLLLYGDGTSCGTRSGIHDQTIICQCCERQYFSVDDYAIKILKHHQGGFERELDGLSVFVFPQLDRRRLRAFFASLLWRGHVSKLPAVDQVDIGSYEAKIRADILTNGSFDYLDAWVVALTDPAHAAGFGMDKTQFTNGVNGFQILLPNLQCIISLDSRPMPAVARGSIPFPDGRRSIPGSTSLSAKDDSLAWIMLRDDNDPSLLQIAYNVVKAQTTIPLSKKRISSYLRMCEKKGALDRKGLGPLAQSFFDSTENDKPNEHSHG